MTSNEGPCRYRAAPVRVRVPHPAAALSFDLTDGQWEVIAPLLPVPLWQTPLDGRAEGHQRRVVADAILYLAGNGIK